MEREVVCHELKIVIAPVGWWHLADEDLIDVEELPPAVDMLNVVSQRIGQHMIFSDTEIIFDNGIDLRVRQRWILVPHQFGGGGNPHPVAHPVSPGMDQVHAIKGYAHLLGQHNRYIVIIGPGPVIREIADAHLVVAICHEPGAVIPRPVRIGRCDQPFAIGQVDTGRLVLVLYLGLLGAIGHNRFHHAVFRHFFDQRHGNAERIPDQHPLHLFKLGNSPGWWSRWIGRCEIASNFVFSEFLFRGHMVGEPRRFILGIYGIDKKYNAE